MRCPPAKALAAACNLLPKQAALIRKLAKCVDDQDLLKMLIAGQCPDTARVMAHFMYTSYSSPLQRREVVLHAIDRILGTCGVEALGPVDSHAGAPYAYCNTGDTYAATVVFERKNDRLMLASWGDLAERYGSEWP